MKKYPQKHFTAEAYRCKDSQNAWQIQHDKSIRFDSGAKFP